MMNRHRMDVRSLLIRIIASHSHMLRQNRRSRRAVLSPSRFCLPILLGKRRKRAYLILVYYNPPPNSIARILPGISCADRPYTGYGIPSCCPRIQIPKKTEKSIASLPGAAALVPVKVFAKHRLMHQKKEARPFQDRFLFLFKATYWRRNTPRPIWSK